MDKITIHYCKRHNEWWSSNCSNCMVDDNEAGIRTDERAKCNEEKAEFGLSVHEAARAMTLKEVGDKLILEQCDPDVMQYFDEYYWIGKDDWEALQKGEL